MSTDYYNILGVAESASKDDIKKAYRKLAMKYHPDRAKGAAKAEAETRFKEISEAYSTLSDDKKRQEYDMLRKYGAHAGGGGFNFGQGAPGQGGFDFSNFGGQGGGFTFRFGGSGFSDLDDILGQFFGGGFSGRQRGPSPFEDMAHRAQRQRQRAETMRGSDVFLEIPVSFTEAATGATRTIQTRDKGKKLRVKIPAGIEDGGKIRLRGQGHMGSYGGDQGDLIITVKVMPDQNFKREGNDIFTSAEVSFKDAILGTKANVKTLTKTVAMTIPPGTQPGTKLRLKGAGLSVGDQTGDLYVEVKVTIPKSITEKQRQLLEEW